MFYMKIIPVSLCVMLSLLGAGAVIVEVSNEIEERKRNDK